MAGMTNMDDFDRNPYMGIVAHPQGPCEVYELGYSNNTFTRAHRIGVPTELKLTAYYQPDTAKWWAFVSLHGVQQPLVQALPFPVVR